MPQDLTFEYNLHERLHLEPAERDGLVTEALRDELRRPRHVVADYESSLQAIARELRPDSQRFAVESARARENGLERLEAWCKPAQLALDAQIECALNELDARSRQQCPQPAEHEVRLLSERLAQFDSVERTVLYAGADARTKWGMELANEATAAIPVRRSDGSLAWEKLLDPEAIDRHRATRRRDLDPEAMQAIQRLERIRSLYVGLASSARALIRGPKR